MEAIAIQKHIRTSPRKLREVVYMIEGLSPAKAMEMLPYSNKRASKPLLKVIKSAVANAKERGMAESDLVFKEIQVNEGKTLKRGLPVSRGIWHPIMKRMSHVRIIVATPDKPKKGDKK